jgi:hypothetical protein
VQRYFANHRGPWQAAYARPLPFLTVAYYNVELFFPSLFSYLRPKYHHRFDDHGDYEYPVNEGGKFSSTLVKRFVDFDNEDVKGIAERCKEKGITLIVILTPNYRSSYEIKGAVGNFNVIDLSQSIKGQRYFYDDIHLNKDGKKILTNALIDALRKP